MGAQRSCQSTVHSPLEGWPIQNKIGDYITIVSDNSGGDVAYSATFNFNPSRGQHEQDVYFRSCIANWWPDTNPHCYAYTDCYSYANTHGNHYTKPYSYPYAKTDPHATIRAHAKAASNARPEAVIRQSRR